MGENFSQTRTRRGQSELWKELYTGMGSGLWCKHHLCKLQRIYSVSVGFSVCSQIYLYCLCLKERSLTSSFLYFSCAKMIYSSWRMKHKTIPWKNICQLPCKIGYFYAVLGHVYLAQTILPLFKLVLIILWPSMYNPILDVYQRCN